MSHISFRVPILISRAGNTEMSNKHFRMNTIWRTELNVLAYVYLIGNLERETRKNREETKVKERIIYRFSDLMKMTNPKA